MNRRRSFRAAVLTAIAANPRLGGLTQISAWASNLSPEALPVIGVVTPRETAAPETLDEFERVTTLAVVLKRIGSDDLEDVLDEDADAIEACVMAAFRLVPDCLCLPDGLSITLNGEGEQKVGTVTVEFKVTWSRAIYGAAD